MLNPKTAPAPIRKVASLFLSDDEAMADTIVEELGSSYLMIDYHTCTSKFWAVLTWAGVQNEKYMGIYYFPQEDELIPVQLFHPEYYQALVIRLYNFDGRAVTDAKPIVVNYVVEMSPSGEKYKRIIDMQEFRISIAF